MDYREYITTITGELNAVLLAIDNNEINDFLRLLDNGTAVFTAGAGRSGMMARAFCMRLMHLGTTSYVVGETTTPGIKAGDVLVICSGSGKTLSLVSMANKAHGYGAKVALITIDPLSAIGQTADVVVNIPAVSPKADNQGAIKSRQPMGNLFEQSLLIFLDVCIMLLMDKKEADAETMFGRHANLE